MLSTRLEVNIPIIMRAFLIERALVRFLLLQRNEQ